MARILVADDETAVREAVVAQLESMGHRCAQAGNGLEALERLHECEYDLVITDVMMPYLNGFQFIKRSLPYLEGRTPILVLSSVDDQDGIAAAVQAGAFDYLTKPVELAEAQAVVEEALRERARMVRLQGRWRGPGGPVPAEALGPQESDLAEAEPEQLPAGVPVFRDDEDVVSIAPPPQAHAEQADDVQKTGQRPKFLKRLFGRGKNDEDAA